MFANPSFSQKQEIAGYAQGTSYSIIYYAEHPIVNKSQIDAIFRQLDSSLSVYKPYSLISIFNREETQSIKVDKHFRNVIGKSMRHYKRSEGRFDITGGVLNRLLKENLNASPSEINAALTKTGMDKISLKGNILTKKVRGVELDVDGIAQGYSVDVIARYLEKHKIKNYLVEIGGEVMSKGRHSDGKPFVVAIELSEEVYETIEICNQAITSSGGKRTIHFDARTGELNKTKVSYVTVIAPRAVDADALDNYVGFLSPHKIRKILKKERVLLIMENGDKVWIK